MAFLLLVGALVTVTCLGRGSVTSPGRGSEVAVRISRENLRSQDAWPLKVAHKRLEKMQKEEELRSKVSLLLMHDEDL